MFTHFSRVATSFCALVGSSSQAYLTHSATSKLQMSSADEVPKYTLMPIKSFQPYQDLRAPGAAGISSRLEYLDLGLVKNLKLLQSAVANQSVNIKTEVVRDKNPMRIEKSKVLAEALSSVAPDRFKIAQALDVKLSAQLESLGIQREAWVHVLKHWCAPHRHYHSITHLESLIDKVFSLDPKMYSTSDKNTLILFSVFHDAFYHPKCTTNEEKSVEMYVNSLEKLEDYNPDVVNCIWITKSHRPPANIPENKLIRTAWVIDNYVVGPGSLEEKLAWERGVKREFLPFFSNAEYRAGRSDFLKGRLEDPDTLFSNEQDKENLRSIYQSVLADKFKIGLFVGSFNPVSMGHQNIIDRAEASDELDLDIVALGIGQNPEKDHKGSIEAVKSRIANKVVEYGQSIVPLMESLSADTEVAILRGVRKPADLLDENKNIEFLNKNSLSDVEMYFIKGDSNFNEISSTRIRKFLAEGRVEEAEALQPSRLSELKSMPPTSYSLVFRDISFPILFVSGGIGTGKSSVCELLQKNNKVQQNKIAPYFSMDKLYKKIFSPGAKLTEALLQFMGADLKTPEGGVNWSKLRDRVMESHPERKRLEFFTHPIINRALSEELEILINNESVDEIDYLVIESPLFFSTQFPHELAQHPKAKSLYINVTDAQQQIARVIQRSKGVLTEEDVQAMMEEQEDPKVCRELADYVLENNNEGFSVIQEKIQQVMTLIKT